MVAVSPSIRRRAVRAANLRRLPAREDIISET